MKITIAMLGGLIGGFLFLYAGIILFSSFNSDYTSWAIFPATVAFIAFFKIIRSFQRDKTKVKPRPYDEIKREN
jgi:hypothetical protein